MEFGAPKRREANANKEKYENIAVLTISEYKGKGTARSLSLNNNAIEVLGFDFDALAADGVTKVDSMISFSFDPIKETVTLANTSGLEGVSGVRLAKTSKSASDKAYFDAIKKHFGVLPEQELELKLTLNDFQFNEKPTMNLSLLTANDKMETVVEEAIIPTAAPVADSLSLASIDVVEEVAVTEEVAIGEMTEAPVANDAFGAGFGEEEVAAAETETDTYAGFDS